MIRIKDLSHSLGGCVVLKDVNLEIPDGTVMGLVGINGAGKSTLFRLLSGVYVPDSGTVEYDGRSPLIEKTREDIFFLPDDPYYTYQTTIKSLISLYSSMYSVNMDAYRRMAELFKLDEKKPLRNYSKGMRRQVYIAIAIAISPKYLFLDEAFDGLDPLARHKVKLELAKMVEKNDSTVIISSHSLREIEDFCDKYTVIDNKTLSSSGNISDRVEKYCKFMLAFADGFKEEMLDGFPTVAVSASGKFVKAVFDADAEETEAKLRALSPTVIERMPVDFEEVFINEVSKGAAK